MKQEMSVVLFGGKDEGSPRSVLDHITETTITTQTSHTQQKRDSTTTQGGTDKPRTTPSSVPKPSMTSQGSRRCRQQPLKQQQQNSECIILPRSSIPPTKDSQRPPKEVGKRKKHCMDEWKDLASILLHEQKEAEVLEDTDSPATPTAAEPSKKNNNTPPYIVDEVGGEQGEQFSSLATTTHSPLCVATNQRDPSRNEFSRQSPPLAQPPLSHEEMRQQDWDDVNHSRTSRACPPHFGKAKSIKDKKQAAIFEQLSLGTSVRVRKTPDQVAKEAEAALDPDGATPEPAKPPRPISSTVLLREGSSTRGVTRSISGRSPSTPLSGKNTSGFNTTPNTATTSPTRSSSTPRSKEYVGMRELRNLDSNSQAQMDQLSGGSASVAVARVLATVSRTGLESFTETSSLINKLPPLQHLLGVQSSLSSEAMNAFTSPSAMTAKRLGRWKKLPDPEEQQEDDRAEYWCEQLDHEIIVDHSSGDQGSPSRRRNNRDHRWWGCGVSTAVQGDDGAFQRRSPFMDIFTSAMQSAVRRFLAYSRYKRLKWAAIRVQRWWRFWKSSKDTRVMWMYEQMRLLAGRQSRLEAARRQRLLMEQKQQERAEELRLEKIFEAEAATEEFRLRKEKETAEFEAQAGEFRLQKQREIDQFSAQIREQKGKEAQDPDATALARPPPAPISESQSIEGSESIMSGLSAGNELPSCSNNTCAINNMLMELFQEGGMCGSPRSILSWFGAGTELPSWLNNTCAINSMLLELFQKGGMCENPKGLSLIKFRASQDCKDEEQSIEVAIGRDGEQPGTEVLLGPYNDSKTMVICEGEEDEQEEMDDNLLEGFGSTEATTSHQESARGGRGELSALRSSDSRASPRQWEEGEESDEYGVFSSKEAHSFEENHRGRKNRGSRGHDSKRQNNTYNNSSADSRIFEESRDTGEISGVQNRDSAEFLKNQDSDDGGDEILARFSSRDAASYTMNHLHVGGGIVSVQNRSDSHGMLMIQEGEHQYQEADDELCLERFSSMETLENVILQETESGDPGAKLLDEAIGKTIQMSDPADESLPGGFLPSVEADDHVRQVQPLLPCTEDGKPVYSPDTSCKDDFYEQYAILRQGSGHVNVLAEGSRPEEFDDPSTNTQESKAFLLNTDEELDRTEIDQQEDNPIEAGLAIEIRKPDRSEMDAFDPKNSNSKEEYREDVNGTDINVIQEDSFELDPLEKVCRQLEDLEHKFIQLRKQKCFDELLGYVNGGREDRIPGATSVTLNELHKAQT